MARKRYTRIPQGLWPYLGPAFDGVDMDIADLEAAVAAGGGTGGGTGGGDRINVQNADGSWRLSRATIDTIHTAGFIVMWIADGSAAKPPAPADGLVNGDIVDGKPVAQSIATITNADIPVQLDNSGTSTDKVRLTKITGVTWTVDGVDHPSSAFTAATKEVPFTKGGNCVVTAKAETSAWVVSGPSSWTFTFQTIAAGGIITSDAFNLPAGTFSNRQSDAALGGSPVSIVGDVTITAQGTAAPKAGDGMYWSNTQDGTASVRIAKFGGSAGDIGAVDFVPFRATSENGSVKVAIFDSGAVVGYIRGAGGGDVAAGFTPTIQAGDVIEVRKAGTAVRFRHMRAGAALTTVSATLPANFSQTTCCIKVAANGWEFDDLIISSATA